MKTVDLGIKSLIIILPFVLLEICYIVIADVVVSYRLTIYHIILRLY